MNARRLVIEIGGEAADETRVAEALDLAAGLAAFGHEVCLVLHGPALARLAGAPAGGGLAERLALLAECGIAAAFTPEHEARATIGPLSIHRDGVEDTRAAADAVLAYAAG